MPFVKVLKTKAYFKRFQVKYKRRRQCRTDYYARKRLVVNDKNKYNSPKYRLCVRFSNKFCVVQVIYADIQGDKVMCEAHSRELKRFGIPAGYKNYCSAYMTGLLCGRRLLKQLGMFDMYTGVGDDEEDEVTGEIMSVESGKKKYFVDELDDDRRPFRVNLDVGLKRTTLGSKLFGALKGAADAGLDIPHNERKFPGYNPDDKEYDADFHRSVIFGAPIADYMRELAEADEENGTDTFEKQFGAYKKAGVSADDLEDLILAAHKQIRTNPDRAHSESAKVRAAARTQDKKFKRARRLSKAERDARVQAKKARLEELNSDSEEESDDDDDEEEDDE